MKIDFDYSLVPAGYAYCINSQCLCANNCLRHQLFLHVPSELRFIKIVNPAHATDAESPCPYFRADEPKPFAVGIKHIFDNLSHKDAVAIKEELLCHFGRNLFYRYWREERMLAPAEQDYIRTLFHARGILSEPAYNKYVEVYEW